MSVSWHVRPSWESAGRRAPRERVLARVDSALDLRRAVRGSWQRALAHSRDPDRTGPGEALPDVALAEQRAPHVLARVRPKLDTLLTAHTQHVGLIMAVGDASGRLLWVHGDRRALRRAEDVLVAEGTDRRSESRVGTGAPGTAPLLRHAAQIAAAEHLTRSAHTWSCSALPIHDRRDGSVIGVLDVAGGPDALAHRPVLEAMVASVENELLLSLTRDGDSRSRSRRPSHSPAPEVSLRSLGYRDASLSIDGRSVPLSLRHAEILTLLGWYGDGLTGQQLTDLVLGPMGSPVALRTELVRLRRVLAPGVRLQTKPYRLDSPMQVDARNVMSLLSRGAHKAALAAYHGPLLPGSDAPGIVSIRAEVASVLRASLLSEAALETVYEYASTAAGSADSEVWYALLRMLPPRSTKRAEVVMRLERIDRELSA